MADKDSVAMLIDSTNSKIQQLQKAFAELESYNSLLLNLKWKQLEEHFHGLENSLQQKFVELENEEKEYVNKVTETEQMLEKKESRVLAKELKTLDRLQEKRDLAVSKIFSKSKGLDANCTNFKSMENLDAKPKSELEILCMEMNVEGLHKYISDNRKNLTSIREEIPNALKSARDPCNLVLDSLKDFYFGENLVLDGKKDGNLLGVRRTCLMLMESLSQLLSDSVSVSKNRNGLLTPEVKERAKAIALEWKPKLDALDIDESNGNSLETHAFLQILATFGIVSVFDEEELCKLVPAVSRRRQTPELCRSLGLAQKMPEVIEVLVNTGRQIDAINLAYAFGLTEQYAPVPLLKSYLKEVRKVSHSKSGNISLGAQNEMNERELSALKAVTKCIEDHKLEEQYPVDPLQKRIDQLEKAKADKRRAAESAKPQSKRARANGSIYTARVTPPNNNFPHDNNNNNKSFYQRATPERYAYPYVYQAEPHHHTMMGSAPYAHTITPATHTAYYGNGYQVHYQAPYIH